MSQKSRALKFSSLAAKLSIILKQRDEYEELQETKFHEKIATPQSNFDSDIEEINSGSIFSMKHIPAIADAISYSINTMTPTLCQHKIDEIDQKMMESSFTKLSNNSSAQSSAKVQKKKGVQDNPSKFNYLQRLCYNGLNESNGFSKK